MVESFYLYFAAFWPKWITVVSAFALFAIEPMARAYWPWLAKELGRLEDKTKQWIEISILVLAVFYAGFSAWHDEHVAKEQAKRDFDAAIGERDDARRQGSASPAQQSTINRMSGDLANARGQIDEQKETISKLELELGATKNQLAAIQTLYASRHLSEEQK